MVADELYALGLVEAQMQLLVSRGAYRQRKSLPHQLGLPELLGGVQQEVVVMIGVDVQVGIFHAFEKGAAAVQLAAHVAACQQLV